MMSRRIIITKDDMVRNLEQIVCSYEMLKGHGIGAEVSLDEYDITCIKQAIATLTGDSRIFYQVYIHELALGEKK